jgi:hypothetical protein
MSSGRKRPVSGRFRVTLDVDWLDTMVEAVKASTGATITMVNGPVLEGRVELEIRPEERAERAIRDWVEAGLDVLVEAPKAPTVEILVTKG